MTRRQPFLGKRVRRLTKENGAPSSPYGKDKNLQLLYLFRRGGEMRERSIFYANF